MTDLATDRPSSGCTCADGCTTPASEPQRSRRQVLLTGGVVVAAAAVTAACGSSAATPSSPAGSTPARPASSDDASPGASSASASSTGGLATTDVPVGGGTIIADRKIVVTQPTAGQFKAFSAVCTHRGCTVAAVSDGLIRCPCHGSQFSIADGSVQGGPAPAPLAAVPVTVSGTTLTLG